MTYRLPNSRKSNFATEPPISCTDKSIRGAVSIRSLMLPSFHSGVMGNITSHFKGSL